MRGLIKTGIATTLHWSGADKLFARLYSDRNIPLVIGYHRVVENFDEAATRTIPPMLVSLATFEKQLDWLARRYEFVTLDDVADWTEGKRRFNHPVAAITFDDGYADLYHHAFPVLMRKGIPAAVFVVTDRVGGTTLQTYDDLYLLLSGAYVRWQNPQSQLIGLLARLGISGRESGNVANAAHDALHATWSMIENIRHRDMERVIDALRTETQVSDIALEEMRVMDWNMLREISSAGVIVGSHTRSHVRLTLEKRNKAVDEIRGSRQAMERLLGCPVEHFAYPGGAFNREIVSVVAEAGYRSAYTTCHHRDKRYPALTIPRLIWWEKSCLNVFGQLSTAIMGCQINGVFDFKSACGHNH